MKRIFAEIWRLTKTAFHYNMIRGAAVIKVIQAVLVLTGRQPWSPEQSASVEVLIDFVVAIIVVVGVNHAHDAQPTVWV